MMSFNDLMLKHHQARRFTVFMTRTKPARGALPSGEAIRVRLRKSAELFRERRKEVQILERQRKLERKRKLDRDACIKAEKSCIKAKEACIKAKKACILAEEACIKAKEAGERANIDVKPHDHLVLPVYHLNKAIEHMDA